MSDKIFVRTEDASSGARVAEVTSTDPTHVDLIVAALQKPGYVVEVNPRWASSSLVSWTASDVWTKAGILKAMQEEKQRAALAKAWDEGLDAGIGLGARDTARNPYEEQS